MECVCEARWDVCGVGSRWSSRSWGIGGRCPGSCLGGFPDLDGFYRSLPESFGSSLDCGTFPVDAVVGLLHMNCDAICGVSSSHCLSVLTQPDFQTPILSGLISIPGLINSIAMSLYDIIAAVFMSCKGIE